MHLAWFAAIALVLASDQNPSTFAEFFATHTPRDPSTPQLTYAQMQASGATLPSGYRGVPKMNGDDDATAGGSVVYATRPLVVCGDTQPSTDDRIADCAAKNPASATWDGATNGNAGQGTWKLVTFNGAHEVWRDERTQHLWSDYLGQENWCHASGNSVDPVGTCTDPTHQDQTTPFSYCYEEAGLDTPAGFDSMKGGMRLAETATSPTVVWRLPTLYDYLQAAANGMHFVLPNIAVNSLLWTATVVSSGASVNAWVVYATTNNFVGTRNRNLSAVGIRCIGR